MQAHWAYTQNAFNCRTSKFIFKIIFQQFCLKINWTIPVKTQCVALLSFVRTTVQIIVTSLNEVIKGRSLVFSVSKLPLNTYQYQMNLVKTNSIVYYVYVQI